MNTSTQLEELVGAWTNLQRQFWDSCLQGKSGNKQSEWESACKRPIEITQEVMTNMLQTQARFTHDIMRYVNPEFSESDIIDRYFESVQELVDTGIKSQQDLLDNVFSIAKEVEQQTTSSSMMQWNPLQKSPVVDWNKAMNNVFHAWENAAEKTLDAQNEFVSHLMPAEKTGGTTAARKPGARSKKSTAGETVKHQAVA